MLQLSPRLRSINSEPDAGSRLELQFHFDPLSSEQVHEISPLVHFYEGPVQNENLNRGSFLYLSSIHIKRSRTCSQ
jgi:hypothetical protein